MCYECMKTQKENTCRKKNPTKQNNARQVLKAKRGSDVLLLTKYLSFPNYQ